MSVQTYAPAATLPRLLVGVPAEGAMRLSEHRAIHGEVPLARPKGAGTDAGLIGEVERAGLLGHGGAAFPLAVKMRAVAAASRGDRLGRLSAARRPVVLVNAAEGEPASLKDRTLLEALPHLVLDGAELAASALGAGEVVVCVCERAVSTCESVARAIEERRRQTPRRTRMRVAGVPSGYVTGQETALVSFLNGGEARPTFTPPLPVERGVRRRPTLVNNPETLAHLALIGRYGAEWFRELGTPAHPGSMLVTLSGCVAEAGVYEVEHGASLVSLLEAAGGLTRAARAILIGGYAGAWVDARHLDALALSDEHLAPYGARVGTGVVVVLGVDACGLGETARVARWLATESAGQCGPCVHGLDAIASALERAVGGLPDHDRDQRIAHLLSIVRGRGACSHPDGSVRFVGSALEVFAPEIAQHAQSGPCAACRAPGRLPLPRRSARERRRAGAGVPAGALGALRR